MGVRMSSDLEDSAAPVRGQIRLNEPMSRHTSWRVGGPADRFFIPADGDDLASFLSTSTTCDHIEWLGLGSNVLIRDGGIRGTVVHTQKGLRGLQQIARDRVRVEAGVPGAKVARFCVRCGLTGAEFLAGIPGTIGGALEMNAGAFGGETWEIVEAVQTVDRSGRTQTRSADEFIVGYRSVRKPADEWFIAAELKLGVGDVSEGKTRISEFLERRGASQPIQSANAGSVFRNPAGDYAARLLEEAGLKGACEGQACVSEQHANFIINRGGARAADIERLIERMRRQVLVSQGVALELEVRVMGELAWAEEGFE
ncbi:MAG: UDP-N-acetylmuramate dehydrogenase [Gammaproteobacteria bacterium]|nr:UDP-N-acetylmuramate dehydrogenase [Gammaproteobacteria bacterium]